MHPRSAVDFKQNGEHCPSSTKEKNICAKMWLNAEFADRHDELDLLHHPDELRALHKDLPPLPAEGLLLHHQGKLQVGFQTKYLC